MTPGGPPTRVRRRTFWPRLLFGVVVGVLLLLQSGLELFSLGMGQSCDVTGATGRAPGFVGVSTLVVAVVMLGFGWKRALRAAGHAAALHIALTGWLVLSLFAYGRCYSQEFPTFLERNAHPIGWGLLAAGVALFLAMRALSHFARRSETQSIR